MVRPSRSILSVSLNVLVLIALAPGLHAQGWRPALQVESAAGQQPLTTANPSSAKGKDSAAKASAEATSQRHPDNQGIKIHGHWKIDVENPDGSLASTMEVENSQEDGGALLSYLLNGQSVGGEPGMFLYAAGNYCDTDVCVLAMNPNGFFAGTGNDILKCTTVPESCSYNVVSSVIAPQQPCYAGCTFALVLSGKLVATTSGQVAGVGSAFATCFTSPTATATVTPAQCRNPATIPASAGNQFGEPAAPSSSYGGITTLPEFTGTSFTPVPVQAGQTISVTVTLTFS
jgi:hypothetical protein